jgi:hypothetical protein
MVTNPVTLEYVKAMDLEACSAATAQPHGPLGLTPSQGRCVAVMIISRTETQHPATAAPLGGAPAGVTAR